MSKSIIDPAPIEMLRKMAEKSGSNLLDSLKKIYIETTPENIEKMRTAQSNKDFEQMKLLAHNLKSSSKGLGATKMAEISELMESHLFGDDEIDETKLTTWLTELSDFCDTTISALKEI